MADTLKDFFIGLGYKLDTASVTKAEAAIKRSEAQITKATQEALEDRRVAEEKAYAERIEAAVKTGKSLDKEERAAADRIIKRQIADEQKRQKLKEEAEKKEEAQRQKSLKNMQVFATKAATYATKAFATIEASALGVVYAVDRAAKSFERVNYIGFRAGSTPGKVGAFGYAASQLGSSREEAEGQLQAFGQNLKTNGSGYTRALARLGIKTRDEKGNLRDSADLATDLGDALRKMSTRGQYGYANAMNQAHVFGFDGDAARAMMNPEFRKRAGEFGTDQIKIGADPDGAAKSGLAFEQSMRRLNEVLEQIGTKISGVLFEKLKPLLDKLSEWFLANGDRIADIVSRIADDLVKLAAAIGQQLAGADWNSILEDFEKMAKGLGAILGKLAGEKGLVAMIAALAIGLRGLSLLAMPPWLLLLLGAGAAGTVAGAAAASLKPGENPVEHNGSELGGGMSGNGIIDKAYRGFDWAKRKLGFGGGGGIGKAQVSANSAAVTDELRKAGYKDNAIAAVLGSMQTESSFNPGIVNGSGHTGLWQWDRAQRWPKIKTWIEQQGGDPKDARWQARAWVAEHDAKPGDSIYDTAQTEAGGRLLRQGRSIEEAVHGTYLSERFGAGEEGGRAANARAWLPKITAPAPAKAPPPLQAAPNPYGSLAPFTPDHQPGVPQGFKSGGYKALGLGADGRPVTLAPQHTSMRGDTNITHNPTFQITGGDAHSNMAAARLQASRGQQDLLRNVQGTLA